MTVLIVSVATEVLVCYKQIRCENDKEIHKVHFGRNNQSTGTAFDLNWMVDLQIRSTNYHCFLHLSAIVLKCRNRKESSENQNNLETIFLDCRN